MAKSVCYIPDMIPLPILSALMYDFYVSFVSLCASWLSHGVMGNGKRSGTRQKAPSSTFHI